MRFSGGKAQTGKRIAEFLRSVRPEGSVYMEPFVGSCNVLVHMDNPRLGSDLNPYLILMWEEVLHGWIPPMEMSIDEYKQLRTEKPLSPLTAFAGFGCSWGGKWFGGYAWCNSDKNYCAVAHRSVMAKKEKLEGVGFVHCDYRKWEPEGWLIYCDPPYCSAEANYYGVEKFSPEVFWDTVRVWSLSNIVVISEGSAPEDFRCVKEIPYRVSKGCMAKSSSDDGCEKLFMWEGGLK